MNLALVSAAKKVHILSILLLSLTTTFSRSQSIVEQVRSFTTNNYAALDTLYKHLHQHPELSMQEENTAKLMANELKKLGFEVQEHIGKHGVAAVLRNGEGPAVLIRTDMDALPQLEKTQLPYASTAKGINPAGEEVPVMHACGHDIHMTVFIGTARALVETKDQWKGTLVFIAQPAEETGLGAHAMFNDDLYDKVPVPDYAIALHDNAYLPAGTLGYRSGPFMASIDLIDITVFGEGGHGASPHTTIDPIVLSSEMIIAFQTIVSREVDPIEPAVLTVGSIHSGNVHNIIPDQVKLQLTTRAYSQDVRNQMLAAIRRISKNIAIMAGLKEDQIPKINVREPQTPPTINDDALTERLVNVFKNNFGADHVVEMDPTMVGEDFSRFGMQDEEVPICMFWLGAVDPVKIEQYEKENKALPSLHSPFYAPLPEPTIKTGREAMSAAALELLD